MTKTVLITGCSSGFGETTAHLFADRGWNVVATMRDVTAGERLAARANVAVVRLDVQDRPSIADAVAASLARFGRIDALVNNAGFGLSGVFEETPRAKVVEQFEVNVFGLMDVTRAVLPIFREQRSGTIVNVTSGAGVFGLPLISLYTASKFAVEGFSESLSYELAGLGIHVRLVEPGGVTSTRFGERSGAEASKTNAIPDYAPFLTGAAKVFDGLRASRGRATSEEVAEVIYAATTDESDRLRWVATDDIRPLVSARREQGEEAYMALMRGQFTPELG
ncbi:SDR family oxidoreductase [Sphingomonas sp. BK235]|uniref:SDR family oxidoreductase n=1 Tax=Sphingomonas sp. BK235 TaxID=2512131 RepID=UPI00104D297A|nr:SDR family oxidoreductase [Sphingomonas sp. BK235]TCP36039.1 short-subunit dehydrogenase [Sphingomonas sp. BK235]